MLRTLLVGGITLLFLLTSFIPFTVGYENTSYNSIYIYEYESTNNNIIQESIDNANSGDTIYIDTGIYYEHIVVDKPLTIIGDGAKTTFVDGMGEDEHIFNIVSEDVIISGFTIRNCSIGFSGIRVNNYSCTIYDNVFRMCGGGVELWDVKDVVVHNNTIEDNIWGVYVHNSIDCSISDNTISDNVYGLELGYSSINIKNNFIQDSELYGILQLWSNQVTIEYNTFENHNNVGLQLYSSNMNFIRENSFIENNKSINLDESSFNSLIDNDITKNQFGIYIWYQSNNNHILNCSIYSNRNGIYLGDSNYNNITSNYINNNTQSGIEISSSSYNNIIKENIILENLWGILLYSSYNNITYNIIKDNGATGIFSTSSSFNNVTYNNFSGNIWGIHFHYFSNKNRFLFNNISNNNVGLWLTHNSSYNVIYSNNINNHSEQGLLVVKSHNNYIDSNHISDNNNGGMVFSQSSNNNNIIGNYIIRNFNVGISFYSDSRRLRSSDNCSIIDNTLIDNQIGIAMSNASNNLISGNLILKNQFIVGLRVDHIGIKFRFLCKNNIITGNEISYNYVAGIYIDDESNHNLIAENYIHNNKKNGIIILESSRYNTIKQNNLIENDNHVFFNNTIPNFWFGNYWDDWDKNLPRPIYGEIKLERLNDRMVPWVQFDWKPVLEPYDINE